MKLLFIAAHPDDLEATISEFLRLVARRQDKHEILIACMTKGEYGTMDPNLRGDKLANIRIKEYLGVLGHYGLSKRNLKFMGLIDGGVTIKAAKNKLNSLISKFKPDILIAPEYQFGVYHHSDHINTGKTALNILKNMPEKDRPKFFVYQSFKNTHYFPAEMKFTLKVLKAHESQFQVIGFLYPMLFLFQLINGFHFRRAMWAQALRKIYFNKKIKLTFIDRLLYHLFKKGELIFHAWVEEE